MMEGKLREYNWRDIKRLIFSDCGLKTEAEQRTKGEMWIVGGFTPPECEKDTCIRVHAYSDDFSTRIEKHAGDK